MKRIFLGICMSVMSLSQATIMNPESVKEASALFRHAGEQVDYTNYENLAHILGFDIGKVETRLIRLSDTEQINVTSTHADFVKTPRTVVARLSSNAQFNSFVPEGGSIGRASLNITLSSDEICITREVFSKYFPASKPIGSTDGGTGLSHDFSGPNKRVIWASFNAAGCATTVAFMQN
jgi:hypothetical protein